MLNITSEFTVGKYKVLKLDGAKPNQKHTKYLIDGKYFDVVPVYDAPNCIAIESTANFNGKTVEFV